MGSSPDRQTHSAQQNIEATNRIMCPVASLTAHRNAICLFFNVCFFFSPLQRYTNRLVAPRLHLCRNTKREAKQKVLSVNASLPFPSRISSDSVFSLLVSLSPRRLFLHLPHAAPRPPPPSFLLHLELLSHLFCISNLGCFKVNVRVCVSVCGCGIIPATHTVDPKSARARRHICARRR